MIITKAVNSKNIKKSNYNITILVHSDTTSSAVNMKQRLTALPILYLHIFPLLLITRKDMQKLNFILTKVVAGNCCLLLNQQLKNATC